MTKKIIVRRKSRRILNFNMDFWNVIKKFITENYTKYSVTISTLDTQDSISDMDDAYEKICQYNDSITTIEIFAETEDENLRIEIYNSKNKEKKYIAKVYAECKNDTKADGVRDLCDILKYRENELGIVITASSCFLAMALSSIFIYMALHSNFSLFVYIIGFFAIFTLCVAVSYLVIIKSYGKKNINFLINYDSIVRKRRKYRKAYCYALSIVIIALFLLYFYYVHLIHI